MLPDNCTVAPKARTSVIQPYCISHGTLEVFSLKASRRFYEEFLGLECVRHGKPAMVIRLGMRFHVVCVEVGDQVHPCSVLNHWGVDVTSRAEVDAAHANAIKYQKEYGFQHDDFFDFGDRFSMTEDGDAANLQELKS